MELKNDGFWQYQTFDDAEGMVDSYSKLIAFKIPSLEGKSVLDIGCNEGYYCGYALEKGAIDVVGIDSHQGFIERAKTRFPKAEFICQTWDILPSRKFDVILFTSSMHYIDTTPDLLAQLKNIKKHLKEDGLLIIECGIVGSYKDAPIYHELTRHDGHKIHYPSWSLITNLLYEAGFGFRWVSKSESGDNVDRLVFHCRHLKPTVQFVMGMSGEGKSTFAAAFRSSKQENVIHVDFEGVELYEERYGFIGFDALDVNGICKIVQDFGDKGINDIAERLCNRIYQTLAMDDNQAIIVEGIVPSIPAYRDVYNKLLSMLSSDIVTWQTNRAQGFKVESESASNLKAAKKKNCFTRWFG